LQGAEKGERFDAPREATQHRPNIEQHEAADKKVAAAKQGGKPAGHRHEQGLNEQVGRDHPLDMIQVGAQVRHHARDRDSDAGAVDGRDQTRRDDR
jgi:hypothetical protein